MRIYCSMEKQTSGRVKECAAWRKPPKMVRVETVRGERIEADYLVAADGANSLIAHSLGCDVRKPCRSHRDRSGSPGRDFAAVC